MVLEQIEEVDKKDIIHVLGLKDKQFNFGEILAAFETRYEFKRFLRDEHRMHKLEAYIGQELKSHELTQAIANENDFLDTANDVGVRAYKFFFNMFLLMHVANKHIKYVANSDKELAQLWSEYCDVERSVIKDDAQRIMALIAIIEGRSGVRGFGAQFLVSQSAMTEWFTAKREIKTAFKDELSLTKKLSNKKTRLTQINEEIRLSKEIIESARGALKLGFTNFERVIKLLIDNQILFATSARETLVPQIIDDDVTKDKIKITIFYQSILHNLFLITNQLAGELR